jgi:6-pyruvoyltetrahydropterin/6-carboxytetrahydropterin synthase
VSDSFSAAHKLCGYEGACKNLHGHNWKVKVTLACDVLDDIGMALDFGVIKQLLEEILGELDHSYLNDLPYFRDKNPTSENLSRYIYERFEAALTELPGRVESVEVFESERSSVTYSHV